MLQAEEIASDSPWGRTVFRHTWRTLWFKMLLWLETRIRSLDEHGNEEMGEVTISIFHPSIHPSVNYLQNFHCFPDILSFIYLPLCQITFKYLLTTGTPTVKRQWKYCSAFVGFSFSWRRLTINYLTIAVKSAPEKLIMCSENIHTSGNLI